MSTAFPPPYRWSRFRATWNHRCPWTTSIIRSSVSLGTYEISTCFFLELINLLQNKIRAYKLRWGVKHSIRKILSLIFVFFQQHFFFITFQTTSRGFFMERNKSLRWLCDFVFRLCIKLVSIISKNFILYYRHCITVVFQRSLIVFVIHQDSKKILENVYHESFRTSR